VTQACTAYQTARGAQKFRTERIRTQREDLARAQAAIRSVQSLREKEATERSVLMMV
jgi:hypothetical protein